MCLMRAIRLTDSTTCWLELWQIDTEIPDTLLDYININICAGVRDRYRQLFWCSWKDRDIQQTRNISMLKYIFFQFLTRSLTTRILPVYFLNISSQSACTNRNLSVYLTPLLHTQNLPLRCHKMLVFQKKIK